MGTAPPESLTQLTLLFPTWVSSSVPIPMPPSIPVCILSTPQTATFCVNNLTEISRRHLTRNMPTQNADPRSTISPRSSPRSKRLASTSKTLLARLPINPHPSPISQNVDRQLLPLRSRCGLGYRNNDAPLCGLVDAQHV